MRPIYPIDYSKKEHVIAYINYKLSDPWTDRENASGRLVDFYFHANLLEAINAINEFEKAGWQTTWFNAPHSKDRWVIFFKPYGFIPPKSITTKIKERIHGAYQRILWTISLAL